jgi:hypothetical protein
MMGKLDTSPIPPWAIQCWATETNIFVALPMTAGGVPYITRYPKSEGGLSMALAVLMKRQAEIPRPTPSAPANYTHPPRQPQVKLDRWHEKLKAETTEAQRENAKKVLEKLGIK